MKMKITIMTWAMFLTVFVLHAQNSYVNKVIIVNEGHYDYQNNVQTVPVTVGTYDPSTHVYSTIDTIQNARFATHVIINGSDIYVAADSTIVRYDANTYQRLATAYVRGARKLAVWNNNLLVSRGEYLQTFDSYFQVFNKNTLGFLYDLPVSSGPRYATEGIIVKDNVAYVAIGNGFDWGNEVGLIGTVNLTTQSYMNEITLGSGGTNPEGMYFDGDNIYTVNNTNYSAASISHVNIASQTASTINLPLSSGCGASGFSKGYVLFQAQFDNVIARFNTTSLNVQDTLTVNRNIYGMAADDINDLIYVGETDYVSYGKVLVYNSSAVAVDSFETSVSPGNIALDVRTTVGIAESAKTYSLSAYPNPAKDQVIVIAGNDNKKETYMLTDITGREVKRFESNVSQFTIDIRSFEAGIYMLTSLAAPAQTLKIVKQ